MFDYRRVIEQTAIAIVAAVAEVVAGIALVALVWSCSGRGRHRSGTRRKQERLAPSMLASLPVEVGHLRDLPGIFP